MLAKRLVFALVFAVSAEAARAATADEAAEWLKALGVPLADAKGYVAATPESMLEVRWVSFARVPAGKLNPSDLAKLAALPKLHEVVFGGNAASDVGVEELAKAVPGLRRLWLFRSPVTDAAFVHVAKFAELEALHIAGTAVTPEAMAHVARLRKLRTLELDETAIGDEGLVAIKGLPALRELSFQGMRGVGANGIAALAAMRRLEILNLGFAEIETTEPFAASRSLRELHLFRTTLDDARAAGLGKVKTLRVLSLSYTAITDAAMAGLAGLPQLQALHLTSTRITDAGVKALAPAKTLVELDLTGTEMGDDSVEALLELPKLASLVLRGTKITNAGAAKLANLKSLKHVDLAGTAVTDQAVAELAKALPDARVVGNNQ